MSEVLKPYQSLKKDGDDERQSQALSNILGHIYHIQKI